MARSRRTHYRSSIVPTLFIGGTAVGLFGLAGLMIAWGMGAFDGRVAQPVDRTGQLAFPALAKPVAAFEAISRDHLINPNTGQLNIAWLPEATAKVASRDVSELIGRVLSRDKNAGMVLTERDFLPAGTKPGVSAGIPPGKFAVTIPTTGIPGLDQLRHGDRFDLMVALTGDDSDGELSVNTEPAAVFGGIKPPSLRVGQLSRQHGVKRLVTSGQMIALTEGTEETTKRTTGSVIKPSASRKSSKTVTYAEIAIDEEEVGPLTEAISLDASMTCIVRSGRPEAEIREAFAREGLIPVITTATAVEAFSELTDEALIDSATQQLHFYYFPPDRVPDHWLTDPTEVYGRVVSRSLRRGSPLTEADLLPIGSSPGISAGVPPGMVAMTINTSQLSGFNNLVQGDRFAIHAKVPESAVRPADSSWIALHGGSLDPATERLEQMLNSGIREVVPGAIYLRISDDGVAAIAVPENRIAEFAQLIRDNVELFVVAQSSSANLSTEVDRRLRNNTKQIRLIATQVSPPPSESQVQVPILTRDVKEYEVLSVQDFIDPATGQIRYVYFPKGRLREDWVTDVSALIDRVTLRALKSGRTVRAADLAPPKSPAGPSAGIGVGMEGVTVDSAQIEDLDILRPGAKFDIVSGQTHQAAQLGDRVRRVVSSSDAELEADKLPNVGLPFSKTIVPGAVLLTAAGSVDRSKRVVLTDRTEKRATINGGIETIVITEQPKIETETMELQRFVIAVPKSYAQRLIAYLDRDRPLRAALSPAVSTAQGSANELQESSVLSKGQSEIPDSINTFVREHFSGEDMPYTEVFVSDRDYSGEALANELKAEDATHE